MPRRVQPIFQSILLGSPAYITKNILLEGSPTTIPKNVFGCPANTNKTPFGNPLKVISNFVAESSLYNILLGGSPTSIPKNDDDEKYYWRIQPMSQGIWRESSLQMYIWAAQEC